MNIKRFLAITSLLFTIVFAIPYASYARGGSVHINGYFRSNGTYVQPHYRSAPDGNPYNNWSFPGNTNPYTGKVAGGNPDTYLKNYYDRTGGNAYSVPSYYTPSPSWNPAPTPSYLTQPPQPSLSSSRQKIYRRAKQAVDLQTGCNNSGLSEAEIGDCFRYALNKDSFDWETIDYPPPQPQVVSQPVMAPAFIVSPTPQTASVVNSPYATTGQDRATLIRQLREQIATLQAQLNALLQP